VKKAFDKDLVKDIGIDTSTSIAGMAAGIVLAGPTGVILGSIIAPVANVLLKRILTNREESRIRKTIELSSQKFKDNISKGASLRKDINILEFQQLTEGILLKAKDTYEEKKISLIANLLASAPFIPTPIDNLNQSLIYAEQLSYRQLCLIAIVGTKWSEKLRLTDKPLSRQGKDAQLDERVEGVYSDLNHLLVLGLIGQILSEDVGPAVASGMYLISPARLKLLYPGVLLYNGMNLGAIDLEELKPLIKILSGN